MVKCKTSLLGILWEKGECSAITSNIVELLDLDFRAEDIPANVGAVGLLTCPIVRVLIHFSDFGAFNAGADLAHFVFVEELLEPRAGPSLGVFRILDTDKILCLQQIVQYLLLFVNFLDIIKRVY